MANITLLGNDYQNVPAVKLPQTGGGTARFDDVSVTTATASDVAHGKVFLAADGTITTGTASGDGYVWQDENGYVHLSDEQGTQTIVEPLSVTQNGTYTATSGHAYSSVTVNVSSGGVARKNDVNFYDYDGTILYSYTAQEASELTALPANPSHSGLTSQGWNYTLAEMKTEVADHGFCEIGQMYITDDGKTRLYCTFGKGRLSPYFSVCPNGTVIVDWGDGSATDTLTGTSLTTAVGTYHTYSAAGDYVITLTVSSGSFRFLGVQYCPYILRTSDNTATTGNTPYSSALKKVELGSNAQIGAYGFNYCRGLKSITIPESTMIDHSAFRWDQSLQSLTFPRGVTSVGEYALYYCFSLNSVSIPMTVTNVKTYAFQDCRALQTVSLPSTLSGSMNTYLFDDCFSLSRVNIPSGMTSIANYAFYYCGALQSVAIPNGVTSIGNYAFSVCPAITSVTIPSTVTSIGTSAFSGSPGIGEYHFLSTTPPTASSNAFQSITTDCKIYVPTGSLSAYTSESNYPSSSTYTYIEE